MKDNFIFWLKTQDCDIAEDVRQDKKSGWSGKSIDDLIKRIKEQNGCNAAIEQALDCYKKYIMSNII